MKIGILTMYYHSRNYGGLLQAFAMVRVLEQLGYQAEQVCYNASICSQKNVTERAEIQNQKRKYMLSHFWLYQDKFIDEMQRLFLQNKTEKPVPIERLHLQEERFSEFERSIPHSEVVYDENTLFEANIQYDAFLTGSDQVWLLDALSKDGYLLNFVQPGKKCISYAVSTGKLNFTPIEKNKLKNKTHNFSSIATREQSFAVLLQKIVSQKVITVLDPTLLLDCEMWSQEESQNFIPDKKYIFVYFLGNIKWHRTYVNKFAKKRKLQIIHLPYTFGRTRAADMLLEGNARTDVGPREFLALLHHAEFVFTDSFHAMTFSTIFKKEFYVFDRFKSNNTKSMNFRIKDFLETFNMEWRKIETPKSAVITKKNDYQQVYDMLLKEKMRSIQYLRGQLAEREE